jgi:hypothetical protein
MTVLQIHLTMEEKAELSETAKRSSYPLATWARGKLLELARAERAAYERDRDEGLVRTGKLAPKPPKPGKEPLDWGANLPPGALAIILEGRSTLRPAPRQCPVTFQGKVYETPEAYAADWIKPQPQPEGKRLNWQDLAGGYVPPVED